MKFRMVDRIFSWQPRQAIRGIKAVSFEEYELRRPLGDEPCLPESLVAESLLQLGGWLMVLSSDFQKTGLLAEWDEFRFVERLRPGRRLYLEIVARSWCDEEVVFDGVATDGRRTIAKGMACRLQTAELAEYADPEDLKVLFSEIHRGEDPEPSESEPCHV